MKQKTDIAQGSNRRVTHVQKQVHYRFLKSQLFASRTHSCPFTYVCHSVPPTFPMSSTSLVCDLSTEPLHYIVFNLIVYCSIFMGCPFLLYPGYSFPSTLFFSFILKLDFLSFNKTTYLPNALCCIRLLFSLSLTYYF